MGGGQIYMCEVWGRVYMWRGVYFDNLKNIKDIKFNQMYVLWI